jgi:hypothetical protein
MLVELFIAFKASKAADSLRRIDESNEYYEYDNGVSGFDRFLAWAEKKPDRVRIEEQLQGKKRTSDGEEEILD